tara:strand:+ start:196 stop:495 length:300 start_codon:yes stop_codon:yes gene_type:complete
MARTSKSRGATPFTMKSGNSTPFKMMGSSPMRDEKPVGSDKENEITNDRVYVDSSTGVVKTAAMERLLRAKPPKDSPNYASWLEAYNKAKAAQTAANTQ